MPDLTAGIKEARAAGYSDQEIIAHLIGAKPELSGQLKEAVMEGYSPTEIANHLAAGPIQTAAEKVTARNAEIDKKYAGYIQASKNNTPPADTSVGGFVQGAVGDTLTGIGQMVAHPIQTAKGMVQAQADQFVQAKDAFQAGDPNAAGLHLAAGLTPVVGPMAMGVADTANSGQYSRALGQGVALTLSDKLVGKVGEAAGTVAGKALNGPVSRLAESSYRSMLKPPVTMTPADAQAMVRTALDNKVPMTPAGLVKVGDIIADLQSKVAQIIKPGAAAGKTIDPLTVVQKLDDLRTRTAKQVNPDADLAAIDHVRDSWLKSHTSEVNYQETPDSKPQLIGYEAKDIPADKAQDIKVGTYQQLKGKYDKISTAQAEAEKALAAGIREELERQFPEIASLNEKEGALIGLDRELRKAVNRYANSKFFSQLAILGLAGDTIGMAIHPAIGMVGLATGAVYKVLELPRVQSALMMTLDRATRGSGRTVAVTTRGAAATRMGAISNQVQSYVNALQQGHNAVLQTQQQPQPPVQPQPQP